MSAEPSAKRARVEDLRDELPEATKNALKEVDNVQNDIDGLNEKASDEILKIEQKYNELRKPLFGKRSEQIAKIPNFWLTTLVNHPQISAIIDEEEEDALGYLSSIEVVEFDDIKSGFKIVFKFKPNEFFENETIVKEYFLTGDNTHSKGTPIKWKPGKNLVKKGDEEDDGLSMSFFEWLSSDVDPGADDVAEVIKDDIWPNPVQFFVAPEVDSDDELDDEGLEEIDDDGGSEGDGDENEA